MRSVRSQARLQPRTADIQSTSLTAQSRKPTSPTRRLLPQSSTTSPATTSMTSHHMSMPQSPPHRILPRTTSLLPQSQPIQLSSQSRASTTTSPEASILQDWISMTPTDTFQAQQATRQSHVSSSQLTKATSQAQWLSARRRTHM